MKWEDALDYCSKCAGGFATFHSVAEVVEVQSSIYSISHFSHEYDYQVRTAEFGLDRRYWIGMRDHFPEEDVWKWVKRPDEVGIEEKEALSLPWYINEPAHNDEGTEFDTQRQDHCVAFVNPVYHLDERSRQEKHTLDDLNCDHQYYFICEAEENSDSPEYDLCKKDPTPTKSADKTPHGRSTVGKHSLKLSEGDKGIIFNDMESAHDGNEAQIDNSQGLAGKAAAMNVIELPPFFSININGMVDDNDQSIIIGRSMDKKYKRGNDIK